MLKIKSRRWVAAWYRCPVCGAQSGNPMLTPYQWKHRQPYQCHNYKCNNTVKEVVEHKWYTTFAIEPGLSQTTIAGTLEKLGPFTICQIVHPNIRVFRRWYWQRKAEEAEKTKLYLERERQIEAERRACHQQQVQVTNSKAVAVAGSGSFDPFLDDF
ncbi:MAG: hypothetical protein ACRDHZ_00090 [Ktedonobacteraceae bacterium]